LQVSLAASIAPFCVLWIDVAFVLHKLLVKPQQQLQKFWEMEEQAKHQNQQQEVHLLKKGRKNNSANCKKN
jgi:hypothetical protein